MPASQGASAVALRRAYLADVAKELRGRKLPEVQVRDILRELSAELPGGDPTAHGFGTPEEFAEGYPEGTTRSLGGWAVLVGALVGAMALLSLWLRRVVLDQEYGPWDAASMVVVFVVALLAGGVVGQRLDRRLPAGVS